MRLQYNLLQHGFRNVPGDDESEGFQLLVKSDYYRGVPLSLIEGFDVTVDGHAFPAEAVTVEIGGVRYRQGELGAHGGRNWPWLEPATLIVEHKGGLAPGAHDVQIALKLRISYMPFSPLVSHFADRLILCPARQGGPKLGASLYSYSGDLQAGTMTLEQSLADLADMGAKYVEFLGDAIVPDFPHPPREWLRTWHKLLEKYDLTPIALDSGGDYRLFPDCTFTVEEFAAHLGAEMAVAHDMGCAIFRGLGSSWPAALGVEGNISAHTAWPAGRTPNDFYAAMLPYAEKHDVVIAEELHIPLLLDCDYMHETAAFIVRTGTERLGFNLDFGIFMRRPAAWLEELLMSPAGANDAVRDYIREARENLVPEAEAVAKAAEMAGPMAGNLARMIYHLTYSTRERNEVSQLAAIAPLIKHCHAKFYDIADDLSDDSSVPHSEIVPALRRIGYDGVISSEYEGDRAPYRAANQYAGSTR